MSKLLTQLSTSPELLGQKLNNEATRALWRFDSAASITDMSGNANHGEVFNGPLSLVPGLFTNAIQFNASTQQHAKVTVDWEQFAGEGLTLGGYLTIDSAAAGAGVWTALATTRNAPDDNFFHFAIYEGRLHARLYKAGNSEIARVEHPTALTPGQRHHVAMIIDQQNGQLKLALDGEVSTAMDTYTSTPQYLTTNPVEFNILLNSYFGNSILEDWFLTEGALNSEDLTHIVDRGQSVSYDNMSIAAVAGKLVITNSDLAASYQSSIIDLIAQAGALPDTLIIQIEGTVLNGYMDRVISTRTSDDGNVWSSWAALAFNGVVNSPVKQYLQVKIELTPVVGMSSPEVLDISAIEILGQSQAIYNEQQASLPTLLDQNGFPLAILENATNIILSEEVNGEEYLTFDIPYVDPKRNMITRGIEVALPNKVFKVRTIQDKDGFEGLVSSIYAEALFYDLGAEDPVEPMKWTLATPGPIIAHILKNTDWTVGAVSVQVSLDHAITAGPNNPLGELRKLQEKFGGDLWFDSISKTVGLISNPLLDKGIVFAVEKNMDSLTRVEDDRGTITRLYGYGKDNMTIKAVNGGSDFIEDYTLTSEKRVGTFKDGEIESPQQLKDKMEQVLSQYNKPQLNYTIKAIDLSSIAGFQYENIELGDLAVIDNIDLGLMTTARIVKRNYNILEPWKTTVEFSTKIRELGDLGSRWSSGTLTLQPADVVTPAQVAELMVFNYLLNSRADQGDAYWALDGFTVDNEEGVTGVNGFKAQGALGVTKQMTQTVWPSTRDNYALSLQAKLSDIVKGPNGKVGVNVRVNYTDGTYEDRFLTF